MTAYFIAAWVICAVAVAAWLRHSYLHAPIERTGTDEQWAALMRAVDELAAVEPPLTVADEADIAAMHADPNLCVGDLVYTWGAEQ